MKCGHERCVVEIKVKSEFKDWNCGYGLELKSHQKMGYMYVELYQCKDVLENTAQPLIPMSILLTVEMRNTAAYNSSFLSFLASLPILQFSLPLKKKPNCFLFCIL